MQALFRLSSGRCRALCLSILMAAATLPLKAATVEDGAGERHAPVPSESLANLVATSPRAGAAIFALRGQLFRAKVGDQLEDTAARLHSITPDGVMLLVQGTEAGPPLLLQVLVGDAVPDVRDETRAATAVAVTRSVHRIVSPTLDNTPVTPATASDTRAHQ